MEIIDDEDKIKQFGVGSHDVPEADIISAWHLASKIFYDGDFEEYFEVKLGDKTHEVAMYRYLQKKSGLGIRLLELKCLKSHSLTDIRFNHV